MSYWKIMTLKCKKNKIIQPNCSNGFMCKAQSFVQQEMAMA